MLVQVNEGDKQQAKGRRTRRSSSKEQDVSQKNLHIDDTVGMFYAYSTVVQRLGTG